jgi:hypothetical protein
LQEALSNNKPKKGKKGKKGKKKKKWYIAFSLPLSLTVT